MKAKEEVSFKLLNTTKLLIIKVSRIQQCHPLIKVLKKKKIQHQYNLKIIQEFQKLLTVKQCF